ncbi:type II and III secretion system protein family protein [Bosea sp. NPDC003192]|uniref:type II and III secretion system protein family protein n=1 Tax=Bosea sp. NPDC003192 TaxID=3390551 RepID=UPI003D02E6ED
MIPMQNSTSSLRSAHKHGFALPLAILCAVLPATVGPALAQSKGAAPVLNVGASEHSLSRRLDLSIGRSLIVELPRDAKEVFVANPKVANAVVRSARKLFIIGMADGSTSMFVMDAEGKQITALEIEVGRDLNVLRQTLRTAMPGADIQVKPAGNSILLVGTVANASEATQAMDIAGAFVGSSTTEGLVQTTSKGAVINSLTIRGRDQVMVKVTVSEVARKAIKQLGINSTGEWKLGDLKITPTLDNPFSVQPQQLAATSIAAGIGKSSNVTLRALERAGLSRILAEPTVTAISGESAKFTAGGEIPVPNGYSCDITGRCNLNIVYKTIGVSLNFTPIVLSEGRISMRIATEVTELDAENQLRLADTTQTGAVNAPGFRTRKSDTTVELPSGGTLATAGLIQRVSRQAINGLPGLMNIPIIGTMFRSRDYQREETELMIAVTPYIVKPVGPNQLQRPDDGFVEAHDAQTILMGRLNKIYGSTSGGPIPQAYKGRVGFIAD